MKKAKTMKALNKKIGLLLTIFCLAQNVLLAQITITQSDMPSQGDTIRTSTGLNLDFADVSETGENFTWDFSQLVSINQTVDTFVGPLQTPVFYWPFFLLSSNLASPIVGDLPIPDLPVTDVFAFYNNSSSNYQDVGFAATLAGIPLPFKYNSPDILYKFPMNYGNIDSSESGYAFGIPDLGYILVERKRVNTVDGWGTLTTPYGTFEVLRQKSEVTEYDSIYIDSLNFGVPVTRNYVEYKWLGKGMKIPILQVNDDLAGLVAVYIDSLPGEPVRISENHEIADLLVFPNPVSSRLFVQFKLDEAENIQLSLLSISGNKIFSIPEKFHPAGKVNLTLNLLEKNLESGNYLLELRVGKKVFTKKFFYNK
ncbi:MAG TPA: T9SS type A sorting domain-containing protein [Bacteroidales bacterium]